MMYDLLLTVWSKAVYTFFKLRRKIDSLKKKEKYFFTFKINNSKQIQTCRLTDFMNLTYRPLDFSPTS